MRHVRVVVIVLVVVFSGVSAYAQYGGGNGSAGAPFELYTPEHVVQFASNSGHWGAHFRLMQDVDMTGYPCNPIGHPFTGVFEGNGHTVRNFTCADIGRSEVGFFSRVEGPAARVENLYLSNANINVGVAPLVGVVAALLRHGTIANCHVSESNVTAGDRVGGLVGWNYSGDIIDCAARNVDVSGRRYVGGLVGLNEGDGAITGCGATGATVTGSTVYIGGLLGLAANMTRITDSYSGNTVQGGVSGTYAGGLVGHCPSGGVQIERCFATGDVSGRTNVGGLVGYGAARILDCYARGEVSGIVTVGGLAGFNAGGQIDRCYPPGRCRQAAGAWSVAVRLRRRGHSGTEIQAAPVTVPGARGCIQGRCRLMRLI